MLVWLSEQEICEKIGCEKQEAKIALGNQWLLNATENTMHKHVWCGRIVEHTHDPVCRSKPGTFG